MSVEKGRERTDAAPPTKRNTGMMNRKTWDWQRLIGRAKDVLSIDVPSCASLISKPVVLRLHAYEAKAIRRERRTFVLEGGKWFERHVGVVSESKIMDYLQDLDGRKDWWVDAFFARDLSPDEVEGMKPDALASLLWNFATIRRRLRSKNA